MSYVMVSHDEYMGAVGPFESEWDAVEWLKAHQGFTEYGCRALPLTSPAEYETSRTQQEGVDA